MNRIIFILCFLLCSLPIWANDNVIDKESSPLEVSANLSVSDYFNPTLADKNSATSSKINAQGKLVSINQSLWWQANYQASYQSVNLSNTNLSNDSSTTTDYLNVNADLLARLYLANNWYLDADIGYGQQDEMLGSGISKLRKNVFIADQKTQKNAALGVTYGGDSAKRNISLNYQYANIDYQNNSYSSLFSLVQQTLTAKVKFVLSSATKFILQLEHQQDDYVDVQRDDSSLQRYLLGIDWQPTGNSKLTALVGQYQRKPDNSEKTTGLTWQLSYLYTPRDDWKTTISSSQSSIAGESAVANNSVKQQWLLHSEYLYSSRWAYGVSANIAKTTYQQSEFEHNLKEHLFSAFVRFNFKQYHDVKLIVGRRKVKESNHIIDYQQNEVNLQWHYAF